MNNKSYIKIIGTILDNSTNQTVAEAFQIYDEDLSKRLSEINAEHEEKLLQKEKCLGFFSTYSDLPTDNVTEGSWAIVPGADGWYVWTYDGQNWQQSSEKYEPQGINLSSYYTKQQLDNMLSDVAKSGSYKDLTDAPVISTVGRTGNYEDLSNKPDIVAKIAEALGASQDAAAALSQLIDQLESEDGATVEGILSSLNNIKNQLEDKVTEQQVLALIGNNSGSGSGSCDCPKHIILTENEYNENDYQKDAIYFILKPGTSGGWTFGGTFPITFGDKWTFGQEFPINLT